MGKVLNNNTKIENTNPIGKQNANKMLIKLVSKFNFVS